MVLGFCGKLLQVFSALRAQKMHLVRSTDAAGSGTTYRRGAAVITFPGSNQIGEISLIRQCCERWVFLNAATRDARYLHVLFRILGPNHFVRIRDHDLDTVCSGEFEALQATHHNARCARSKCSIHLRSWRSISAWAVPKA